MERRDVIQLGCGAMLHRPLRRLVVALIAGRGHAALADPPASQAVEVALASPVRRRRGAVAGGRIRAVARRSWTPSGAAPPTARPASRTATYIPDVCRAIETAAGANALDPNFFVRLVWKESLFDAAAISPAGAQGIAQFMPGHGRAARARDPFNPAEALQASARYLADLSRAYGNIGLAAVAYNGGEARAERFVAGAGGLPLETRAYVAAITGHTAETWRDAPPPAAGPRARARQAVPGGVHRPCGAPEPARVPDRAIRCSPGA